MNAATLPQTLDCLARSRVYAYLAAWLRYPDRASWEDLTGAQGRASFAEACDLLAQEKTYNTLRRHRGGIRAEVCPGPEELEDHFQRVFGHTISKECPPCETEYGRMHLFQQTDFLADLAGFYRAFGLEVKERVERADHISTELEFLHVLTFKEARARERGRAEEAGICRDAQVSFLEDHLGRWGAVFAGRLERRDPDGPFGDAARLLSDFLRAEAAALSVDADLAPDFARGESLPAAADEWNSAEWMQGDNPCAGLNGKGKPCP